MPKPTSARPKKSKAQVRIAEAARSAGISPSTLRRWVDLGLVTCSRSAGGFRFFSRSALRQLKRVERLRTVQAINPKGIRHLDRFQRGKRGLEQQDFSLEQVVKQLASVRQQRGLRPKEVADKVGLSVPALLALEQGRSVPSVAVVKKLAQLFDTTLLSFVGSSNFHPLLRPGDRPILRAMPGVEMELLALGPTMMQPHLLRVAPGSGSGGYYQHEGEEFIYVLDGKCEIWLDELQRYVLEPGDSLYFQSARLHKYKAIGDQEAVLLWVNTPPTF